MARTPFSHKEKRFILVRPADHRFAARGERAQCAQGFVRPVNWSQNDGHNACFSTPGSFHGSGISTRGRTHLWQDHLSLMKSAYDCLLPLLSWENMLYMPESEKPGPLHDTKMAVQRLSQGFSSGCRRDEKGDSLCHWRPCFLYLSFASTSLLALCMSRWCLSISVVDQSELCATRERMDRPSARLRSPAGVSLVGASDEANTLAVIRVACVHYMPVTLCICMCISEKDADKRCVRGLCHPYCTRRNAQYASFFTINSQESSTAG